ncbi:anaphase-promoting complex subunit 7-like isoform X2 [Xenia sp. Carnegie-2017]|uniref:anaphase-promoting complex subunit 7-like isoform X2 n=1 Tax=Xenia sp. Carnegie-2017 TaxID=2897299 RepID=UPI001F049CE8|nr:anaphase-promoting complex subunit 7-like isoform X2 [Xenia sp. Carnegie-2017]XP_046840645.1 anaphase-promoting complex subunit 7-like isoform X2 [Xenia sp. Carnegie-2017]
MTLLLEQVKRVNDAGLLSNLRITAGLVLSSLPPCKSNDLQGMANHCILLVYYADSLFESLEFRRAEKYYQTALQYKKNLMKKKYKSTSAMGNMSDVDIRYKIYLCQMKLKDYKSAQKTLDDIPPKQRSPQITMCLAKLYHKLGIERPAIACYKDVLRSCPLALEAAMGLLQLGQNATEVTSLMSVSMPSVGTFEWLLNWLKAYALKATSKFTKAAQQLKTLESQHLRDNVDVLCLLAECQWQSGDLNNAKTVYNRVRSLDEKCLQGMDLYASLLAQNGEKQNVESLAEELIGVSEDRPEPWIAMAHSSSVANKKTRAIYFAQKAHNMDNQNIQALLTKGSLLSSVKRKNEAIDHYREVTRLSPNNYEGNKGLIECYLASNRHKEALVIAKNAHKCLGTNPRTLLLLAMVLSKESQTQEKAKQMLEKAIAQDPMFADAVYDLAEMLTKEQNHEGAVELLRKHLTHIKSANLHILLGDNLASLNEYQEALDQYSIGISMCPGHSRAIAGIHRVESLTAGTVRDSPDDLAALDERNMIAESSEENSDDDDWEVMNRREVWF